MHPRLQELLDHHDIRQLLAHYCHGCDRMDEVEMAATYAADSWDDHGPRKMQGRQFAIDTVAEASQSTTVVSHQLGQSLIKLDGDRAGVETYFIATLMYPPKDGVDVLNQLGGRYVDELVRENGKWLIAKRICVREWSCSQPVAGDFLAKAGFVETQRGQDDVSYAALGMAHSGNPWL